MSAPDYFALLGLARAVALDAKALEAAYFAQQRLYHPDRFVKKTPAERQEALLRSVDINNAYETLKNPLLRAQYLLHLQGIEVGTDNDTVKPSAPLLMETMKWREAIDEAQGAAQLESLEARLAEQKHKTMTEIETAYNMSDWQAMAAQTLRLGYIVKAQAALQLRRRQSAGAQA